MARMTFRERNMMKWVGVRPAHNGEQVLKTDSAAGAITALYTVPAGGVFYLTFASLVVAAGAAGWCRLYIEDDVGATQIVLLGALMAANDEMVSSSVSFTYPIECLEDWVINVRSNAVGLNCIGNIAGWID
jgi:hypothetical protein